MASLDYGNNNSDIWIGSTGSNWLIGFNAKTTMNPVGKKFGWGLRPQNLWHQDGGHAHFPAKTSTKINTIK